MGSGQSSVNFNCCQSSFMVTEVATELWVVTNDALVWDVDLVALMVPLPKWLNHLFARGKSSYNFWGNSRARMVCGSVGASPNCPISDKKGAWKEVTHSFISKKLQRYLFLSTSNTGRHTSCEFSPWSLKTNHSIRNTVVFLYLHFINEMKSCLSTQTINY